MLLTEMLERAFEFKLLRKEYDSISDDGKFMRTETVVNEYTKGLHIKSQNTHVQIRNLDEKVIQESSTYIDFKTNKNGDITQQSISIDNGAGLEETLSVTKYTNKYGKSNELLYSYAKSSAYSMEAKSNVECLKRTAYAYDEIGKLKVIICDCIPVSGAVFQVSDVAFLQTYLLEYNDAGMLSAINLTDVNSSTNDYKYRRFVVNYTGNNFIKNIHRIDADVKEDEYFQYFSDGTVSVIKNDYDKEGAVISKTNLTFSFLN